MITDRGRGGSSTTLATISGCPDSTAASTATTQACASNGTSSVASSTGRPPDSTGTAGTPDLVRLRVDILLRTELPPGEVPRPAPDLPAPQRHVPEEPESQDDRHQEKEPLTGEGPEQREHGHDGEGRPHHREPVPAHLPHDAPVRLGRDLRGVPATATLLARPALPVGNVPDVAALAADGDGRAAHPRAPRAQGRPRHETASRPAVGCTALALHLALADNVPHYRTVSGVSAGSSRLGGLWHGSRARGTAQGVTMAEAVIEERQLLKTLRWYDGFVIALCNPGFLIASLGFTLDSIGVLGSLILWGASATIGLLQNWIYSESAAMFPDKPGGISLYAHEGWRRYFSLFGPIAAFGYWIGWSVVLSIFGNLIGGLIIAEWFPGLADNVFYKTGLGTIGPAQLIGVGLVVAVWLFNIFGVRPSLTVGYVTGALLMIPLFIFIVLPYFTGDWHSSNLHYATVTNADGVPQNGLLVALMW